MDDRKHQSCEQLVKDVKDLVDDFQARLAQLVSNHWGTDIPVQLLEFQGTTLAEVKPQRTIIDKLVKLQETTPAEVKPQRADRDELLKSQGADTTKLLAPPGITPADQVKPLEDEYELIRSQGTTPAEKPVQGINEPGNTDKVDDAFLIPCPSCPLKFEQRSKLERHWFRHVHCPFVCDFCQFETRNLSSRVKHFHRCSHKASYPAVAVEASSELLRGRTRLARANLDAILTPMGLGKGQIRQTPDPDESLQNQESDPEMLGLERDSLYSEFIQSITAPQKNRCGFQVDAETERREMTGLSLPGLSRPDITLPTPSPRGEQKMTQDEKPRDEKARDQKPLDALRVSSSIDQDEMIQAALRDAFPVDQDEMLESALKISSPIDHDKIVQDVLKISSSVDKMIQDDKMVQDALKVSSPVDHDKIPQDALRVSSPVEPDKIQDASRASSPVDHVAQTTQDALRISADNRRRRVRLSLAALKEGRATSPYGRRIPEGAWENSLMINYDPFSPLGTLSQSFTWSQPPRNGGQEDIEEVT